MTKASDDPRWQNLTHKERCALLETHRDTHVYYEWWDCVYEDFVNDMGKVGIYVKKDNVTFSGFWSQGSGAAFAGRVDDWAKVFKHLGMLLKLDNYRDNLIYMRFEADQPRNNRMRFDSIFDMEECPHNEDDEPLQYSLWHIMRPSFDDLGSLSTTLREMFEEAATELYKSLEAEYDYLTDDEQVIEYILENVEEFASTEEICDY